MVGVTESLFLSWKKEIYIGEKIYRWKNQGEGWYFGAVFLVVWSAILRAFKCSLCSVLGPHFCESFPAVEWADDFCLTQMLSGFLWWHIWHVWCPCIHIWVLITSPWLQEDKSKGCSGLWEAGSELLLLRMCDHSLCTPGLGDMATLMMALFAWTINIKCHF